MNKLEEIIKILRSDKEIIKDSCNLALTEYCKNYIEGKLDYCKRILSIIDRINEEQNHE